MIITDKNFPYVHFLTEEEVFTRAFKEATDEELQLTKLSAPELARRYHEAKVKGDEAECTLIQHYMSLRLVALQVKATEKASHIGILGVVLGVLIGYVLISLNYCH